MFAAGTINPFKEVDGLWLSEQLYQLTGLYGLGRSAMTIIVLGTPVLMLVIAWLYGRRRLATALIVHAIFWAGFTVLFWADAVWMPFQSDIASMTEYKTDAAFALGKLTLCLMTWVFGVCLAAGGGGVGLLGRRFIKARAESAA